MLHKLHTSLALKMDLGIAILIQIIKSFRLISPGCTTRRRFRSGRRALIKSYISPLADLSLDYADSPPR